MSVSYVGEVAQLRWYRGRYVLDRHRARRSGPRPRFFRSESVPVLP